MDQTGGYEIRGIKRGGRSYLSPLGQANMLVCSFDPQIKVERFSFNLWLSRFLEEIFIEK